jgi:hypothetical protein
VSSREKIDSVYDFTDKGLVEIKAWLEPWFKTEAGGGSGIQFDTNPQAGGYLVVTTTSTGAAPPEGITLTDEGDGGITLYSFGTGRIRLEAATSDTGGIDIKNDSDGAPVIIRQTGGPEYPDGAQPDWVDDFSGALDGVGLLIQNSGAGSFKLRNTGDGPFVIDAPGGPIDVPGITLHDYGSGVLVVSEGSDIVLDLADGGGNVIIKGGLPTSDPSVAGALWNNGGALMVSAG